MRSINVGIRLENDNGVMTEHSFLCSADTKLQPVSVLRDIITMLNDECGTKVFLDAADYKKESSNVTFTKSPKIKATRGLSHKTFNKKIKELGYD